MNSASKKAAIETEEVGKELAEAETVDVLPEDLQPDLVDHEDYIFPNNNRRRIPGYLYLAISIALLIVCILWPKSVFVNSGTILAALGLALFGAFSIVSGKDLKIDERQALIQAIDSCGFPVGHASAQMAWQGIWSTPVWRILLYSADEPPTQRGFVFVDGVTGEVLDTLHHENPEDWTSK